MRLWTLYQLKTQKSNIKNTEEVGQIEAHREMIFKAAQIIKYQ